LDFALRGDPLWGEAVLGIALMGVAFEGSDCSSTSGALACELRFFFRRSRLPRRLGSPLREGEPFAADRGRLGAAGDSSGAVSALCGEGARSLAGINAASPVKSAIS
jgi:hypothetical protein